MPKVLVIAYYTPPLGMSGVMRVTKLSKFLPEFGWQPVILTIRPPLSADSQLLKDLENIKIYRSFTLDPANLSKLKSASGGQNSKLKTFGRFLFPDSKIFWLPFGYWLGKRVIEIEKPAIIFATAPPFTSLLLGWLLSQTAKIPLVSDFRDPWPQGFIEPKPIYRFALKKLRNLIIKKSSRVLAVNYGTMRKLSSKREVIIIENGYDPDDFKEARQIIFAPHHYYCLYAGNLWQNEEELQFFLQATEKIENFQVVLCGGIESNSLKKLKKFKNFNYLGVIPHSKVIGLMKQVDFLLYFSKPNQSVGLKLYEYFGAGKPILVIEKECTEAGRLVENHKAGFALNLSQQPIFDTVSAIIEGKEIFAPEGLERFSFRHQAERISKIFNRITRIRRTKEAVQNSSKR